MGKQVRCCVVVIGSVDAWKVDVKLLVAFEAHGLLTHAAAHNREADDRRKRSGVYSQRAKERQRERKQKKEVPVYQSAHTKTLDAFLRAESPFACCPCCLLVRSQLVVSALRAWG